MEACWYCRLLARGEGHEDLTDTPQREDACNTPPTATNNLPAVANLEKQKCLNIMQLVVVSGIFKKETIKQCRTSSDMTGKSWLLTEIVSEATALNQWECGSPEIRALVSQECEFYASTHAAYYYRNHPRVCSPPVYSHIVVIVYRSLSSCTQLKNNERDHS
jgi:hypothetical protein